MTAYEFRISDWSSDVCASDLGIGADRPLPRFLDGLLDRRRGRLAMIERGRRHRGQVGDRRQLVARRVGTRREIEHGRNEDDAVQCDVSVCLDRSAAVSGKSGYVSVVLGGSTCNKKTKR